MIDGQHICYPYETFTVRNLSIKNNIARVLAKNILNYEKCDAN